MAEERIPDNNPPRVGIAGYSTASWLHVPPIREAGGVVAVVATRTPSRRAQAESDSPDVEVVDDLDELLQVPDLDAVVLGTPSGMHHAHALQEATRLPDKTGHQARGMCVRSVRQSAVRTGVTVRPGR